jgi:flagella basal body P-ring formation protein FlgA
MRSLLPILPALLCSCALCSAAAAAELRPYSTLADSVVRLSDLFDGAGAAGSRVLGPGPTPGNRIVVESAQLAAIARQFGVDWHPVSSADRAVLERPGRPLPREAVLQALQTALAAAGADPDCEVELPAYDPPMVPPDGLAPVEVAQLDFEQMTGRFQATLSIAAAGMAPIHLPVAGTVQEMQELAVPVHRLMPGTVIAAGDLHVVRVRASRLPGDPVRRAEQAIGLALRHPAMPGQPVMLADLGPPVLVQKGEAVAMSLDEPGLALNGQGQALDPGAMGEHIRVLNRYTRAVLEAEVTGTGAVRVLPGSMPLQPPEGQIAPGRLVAAR